MFINVHSEFQNYKKRGTYNGNSYDTKQRRVREKKKSQFRSTSHQRLVFQHISIKVHQFPKQNRIQIIAAKRGPVNHCTSPTTTLKDEFL